LILFLGLGSHAAAGIIYSDLGSGQNGAYVVGSTGVFSGAWFAVPWISAGPSTDFLMQISSTVLVNQIDVSTTPGVDDVITVDLVNGEYAFATGTIIGSASVTVNNGLSSVMFPTPIELDPGQNYWIYFTALNLADYDYDLVSTNTVGRLYEAEYNYYPSANLPGFDVQGQVSPEPTTSGLTVLGGAILLLARRRRQHDHQSSTWRSSYLP
jgi:hypothetical protein